MKLCEMGEILKMKLCGGGKSFGAYLYKTEVATTNVLVDCEYVKYVVV